MNVFCRSIRVCLLLIIIIFSLVLAIRPQVAQAEERAYSDKVPLQTINWNKKLSIPQFDPALGLLTKIEFVLVGEVYGAVGLENLDAAPATVSAESVADVQLERPDGTFITMASPMATEERQLATFDNTIDFAGTSGTTIEGIVGINIAERVVYTTSADLSHFIGSGTIELGIRTTGRSRATGAGNLALSFSTAAGAELTVTYTIAQPAIDLEKWTNGEDADQRPGPLLYPGELVTWTYLVTNIGEVPLVDLKVVDDQEGSVTASCPQNQLAVAESMRCTLLGIAQQGQYTNTATVTGTVPSAFPGEPRRVTDKDPSHYYGLGDPAIDLEKWTNGEDADLRPGPLVAAGNPITWTYRVHNVGAIDLEAITLIDDREGDVTTHCPQTTLAVGERMICTVTGIAQLGQYSNTAVVTGTTAADALRPHLSVTDTDPSHYFGTEMTVCPRDGSGVAILPAVRYLGEGAGLYTLDHAEERFVIKKLSPFRFVTSQNASYQSTRVTGAPERVWACSGECAFTRALNEVITLGALPAGTMLHLVILDDDDDARVNTIFADDRIDAPLLRLEAQTTTAYLQVPLPEAAIWHLNATDSIGLLFCAWR